MSRSNPSEHLTNPAKRWFEWNGEAGTVRYYDKEAKQNVNMPLPFTFLLLDQLGTVKGWHDPSQSGIYANEVKDTRQEVLIVKAFKGGVLAEGRYRDIKDRIHSVGGAFVANCYMAFKNGSEALEIGSIRFKGAALGAWMEFTKAHRSDIYKQAIQIASYSEGKKGRIVFRMPVFKLVPISVESDRIASGLDRELQTFLSAYFKRNTKDQIEAPPADYDADNPPPDYDPGPPSHDVTADDIPF